MASGEPGSGESPIGDDEVGSPDGEEPLGAGLQPVIAHQRAFGCHDRDLVVPPQRSITAPGKSELVRDENLAAGRSRRLRERPSEREERGRLAGRDSDPTAFARDGNKARHGAIQPLERPLWRDDRSSADAVPSPALCDCCPHAVSIGRSEVEVERGVGRAGDEARDCMGDFGAPEAGMATGDVRLDEPGAGCRRTRAGVGRSRRLGIGQ
jgi:hypothetical protein